MKLNYMVDRQHLLQRKEVKNNKQKTTRAEVQETNKFLDIPSINQLLLLLLL
jgi:hypothetical protein